jgi:hypothetical protein
VKLKEIMAGWLFVNGYDGLANSRGCMCCLKDGPDDFVSCEYNKYGYVAECEPYRDKDAGGAAE